MHRIYLKFKNTFSMSKIKLIFLYKIKKILQNKCFYKSDKLGTYFFLNFYRILILHKINNINALKSDHLK
jgi:hypothetical protein